MPKRSKANGEGSIVYYSDKKKYRAFITDTEGKRLSRTFSTKTEADKWLAEIKTEIAQKTYIPVSDKKLIDWVFEYIDVYKKDKLRVKTIIRYMQTAKYLMPIGDIKLQDLTAHQVQKFYKDLPDISASSKIKIHNLLAAAIKKAFILGSIKKNIMLAVERPKPTPVKIEIFTNNELTKISSAILGNERFRKYYPIYLMGITTGARLGEILGLKRCSIGNGYILINNSLQQLSGKGLYDEEPKTEAGKRKITITPKLQNCFAEIFQEQKIISLDGYVFTTIQGTPISPSNFHDIWKAILQDAGVKYKHFHCLRHTHATQLLAAGIPVLEVAKRLGHAKASYTLNIYGHAIPDYDKSLPDKISSIFAV